MGTSKSYSTPSGGEWTGVKRAITALMKGTPGATASSVVGGVLKAAGGLSSGPANNSGTNGVNRSVSGAIAGLGSFANGVQSEGLASSLHGLGLDNLIDRPAAEVIAAISERLSEGTSGLDGEILAEALREALLEIAGTGADGEYISFEAALNDFLSTFGIDGLIEVFLKHYVFSRIWLFIERHVAVRAEAASSSAALSSAVEVACLENVRQVMSDIRNQGRLQSVDWFGREGQTLAASIVQDLETRLRTL